MINQSITKLEEELNNRNYRFEKRTYEEMEIILEKTTKYPYQMSVEEY